jgi:hypothetical protein
MDGWLFLENVHEGNTQPLYNGRQVHPLQKIHGAPVNLFGSVG